MVIDLLIKEGALANAVKEKITRRTFSAKNDKNYAKIMFFRQNCISKNQFFFFTRNSNNFVLGNFQFWAFGSRSRHRARRHRHWFFIQPRLFYGGRHEVTSGFPRWFCELDCAAARAKWAVCSSSWHRQSVHRKGYIQAGGRSSRSWRWCYDLVENKLRNFDDQVIFLIV